jgi:hypothetical protein
LQDQELSEKTGYDRTAYCNAHGLADYQSFGSEPLVHSIERGNDERDPGIDYRFESNGVRKSFEMRKFLNK